MNLFDTHAHLTDEAFKEDLDEVILRAVTGGVNPITTIGLDEESSLYGRQIAHRYGLWFTAGIHPSESANANEDSISAIARLLTDVRCVAVGEIGLDYYWPDPPPEPQQKIFRSMLELASRTGYPIVIHQRNSFDDVIKLLDEYSLPGKGIFHCFGGGIEQAEEIIERGFFVSFAGNVTFKKGRLDEVIRAIPIDRLLIETDAPYLSPVPFRGKRNEPDYVKYTATKIAEILGLSLEEIGEITTRNAKNAFNIPIASL